MSQLSIYNALNKHLFTLNPVLPTALENGTFEPQQGQPYQVVNLLPADTQTRDLREKTIIESGVYQISVYYPSGQGANAARARAEALREHYAPGVLTTEDGIKVEIRGKASVRPAMSMPGWFIVPVQIRFKAIA